MGGEGGGSLPQASLGQTRDKVAATVGMSGRTYEKAKAVIQVTRDQPEKEKAFDAVALGRKGGPKGGKARAQKLTPEQRKEIAKIAANERWRKED